VLLLLLQIFWSATFMAVPDLLLQMDQFSGWMMCLHQAMRKPLPWVSTKAVFGKKTYRFWWCG
jgi:hypothetical protein